jgi:peptide-methionine (S)-S-oxide reductase
MNKIVIVASVLVIIFGAGMLLWNVLKTRTAVSVPNLPPQGQEMHGNTETAVLAGGCFWGVEGVFERLKGVMDVTSGYAGGEAKTAHYSMVSAGTTGHAESVRVTFDPSIISYTELLEVFFSVAHDPTQLNYQGPDKGSQYRSAIFYTDEHQKGIAEEYIRMLERDGIFKKPIVTQVVPLKAFYPAEDHHQDFMDRNPNHPYIVYWDVPKVEHLKKAFPELLVRQ